MDGYSDFRGFGQNENIGQVGQSLGQERQDRLSPVHETDRALIGRVPIEDAWGWSSSQLRFAGSAGGRSPGPPPRFGNRRVTLERTQRELSGIACLEMEEVPQPRKNTCCSRSSETAHRVEELEKRWPTMQSAQPQGSLGRLTCLWATGFSDDQPFP